jgi:hypothetical protein
MPQAGSAERDGPDPSEDRFEREVGRSPIFAPIGAIGWGVLIFVLLQSGQGTSPADFAASIASGVFIACYVFFVGRQILIRWLITKRSWPSGARRVILTGGFLGLPLLAYGLVQFLIARH